MQCKQPRVSRKLGVIADQAAATNRSPTPLYAESQEPTMASIVCVLGLCVKRRAGPTSYPLNCAMYIIERAPQTCRCSASFFASL